MPRIAPDDDMIDGPLGTMSVKLGGADGDLAEYDGLRSVWLNTIRQPNMGSEQSLLT